MISPKYSKIYNKFIEHYKNKHVNPWHEISEEELEVIYANLVNNISVTDDYNFDYFMNYIIKQLSGLSDAHTFTDDWDFIPLLFRVFKNEVYISWPDELKGAKVLSINNIPLDLILDELEKAIIYGTEEQRIHQFEKALFNARKLYGLPHFRLSSSLTFLVQTKNGLIENKTFAKREKYPKPPFNNYWNSNAKYEIKKDVLVYNHFSIQKQFEESINSSISKLRMEDLSYVSKIIIDLRGNTGGNAELNKPLIDFISENKDKILIVLTDYRIFSGGRYALIDLIKLGAITIGTGIGTPLNCYGNSNWINIDGHAFSSSESYLAPSIEKNIFVHSKEEFKNNITEADLFPSIFKPDIYIEQTIEDFLNGNDPIMDEALSYQPSYKLK